MHSDPNVPNSGHGSPYDRGGADSYYQRSPSPHLYRDGFRVLRDEMTPDEIKEYFKGYRENEEAQCFKDWGDDREDGQNHAEVDTDYSEEEQEDE